MIKGIIFDLDGTLIDSMKIWYDVDRNFLRENGVTDPPADISERVKKMTVDQSSQYFIDLFHLSVTKEYVIKRIEDMVREEYEHHIPLKPYVEETLDMLDGMGIPYGVATATYKALAEAVLKRCGIYDRFRFVLTDIDYPRGKKFPDIFLGGAQRLGCSPDEALVIEDSLHCIQTAKKAGLTTAGIYEETCEPDRKEIMETADYYLMSLAELKSII